jgi:hypothetical protein
MYELGRTTHMWCPYLIPSDCLIILYNGTPYFVLLSGRFSSGSSTGLKTKGGPCKWAIGPFRSAYEYCYLPRVMLAVLVS